MEVLSNFNRFTIILFTMESKGRKKKNRNKNNKDDDSTDIELEVCREEIELILKNSGLSDKVLELDSTKKLKNAAVHVLSEFKEAKNANNIEAIYKLLVEKIKESTQAEVTNTTNKVNIEYLEGENKKLGEGAETLRARYAEQDKLIKMMKERIKTAQDERKKIAQEEMEKRDQIIKKYEEIIKNFQDELTRQIPEKEALVNENSGIRKELDEITAKINEAAGNSKINKLKKMEEQIATQMNQKMTKMLDQTKRYAMENAQLRAQLENYSSKYDELSGSLAKYNELYESLKKTIENKNLENSLHMKDYTDFVQKDNALEVEIRNLKANFEKKEKQNKAMLNLNKTLQDQLKNLQKAEETKEK